MRPHELVDVTVRHPLRHHPESTIGHRHPHQRQDIWMAKGLPRRNFLAKPLIGSQSDSRNRQARPPVTYSCDLLQVACLAYPQNFDGDFSTLMFSLPHVCKPALVQRNALSVVARRDVKGFQKDDVASAYLVQGFETFLSDLWCVTELVQCLVRYINENVGVVPME